MRRKDRARDRAFSLALIDRCTHGIMALNTGETPYCLPLSFVRVGDHLYFHSALAGRKLELLRADPRVCVTFVGGDSPAFVAPAMYTTYFRSVIVTGTACEVTDETEKIDILRVLCQKLTPNDMADEKFLPAIQNSLAATGVWKIHMEDISGKAKE